MSDPNGFRFAYEPGVIRFGADSVETLERELATLDCSSALVVCGRTVGSNAAVIDPVRDGLGSRLGGVFDRTTPDKRLSTAVEVARQFERLDADALVALGGGSSIDIAKIASIVAASDRDPASLGAELEATGEIALPAERLPPLCAIPTTLAGADLSQGAGITASPDGGLVEHDVHGSVSDPRLMPAALWYDPTLVRTTPRSVLAASAMNGFDKGIETVYARSRTPVTDATATHGLGLLADGLPTLADEPDAWALGDILHGIVLVQYGISRPDRSVLSLIHAFGHGVTAHAAVQQGVAHGVLAPHALDYLFAQVDGRRELLADALGVPAETDSATGTRRVVENVRDALSLPDRLSDVDGIDRSMLDAMAETTAADSLMENVPEGLHANEADLRGVLDAAW